MLVAFLLNNMTKNNTFKLGRSVAHIIPFHVPIPIKKQQLEQPKQQKEIISNKLSKILFISLLPDIKSNLKFLLHYAMDLLLLHHPFRLFYL
jgi:hypothetical protein